MKKNLLLSLAAMFALTASAAEFPVTFSDNKLPEGWSCGTNYSLSDGHLNVIMSGTDKFRQDLCFSSGNEATDYKVNASEYKIMAMKFIGDKPDQNNTLEIQFRKADGSLAWMNTSWKNKSFTVTNTTGGNTICYWDLTKDAQWTGELSINKINFKIADNVVAKEYTIDWINVYPSVEAIEKDWQDDGNADADEGTVATFPVMIGNNGFNNIKDAFSAVKTGETITVNESQTISGGRVTVGDGKEITVKGAEGVTITDGNTGANLMILVNGNAKVTFEDLTFLAANEKTSMFEITAGGHGYFNNVAFKQVKCNHDQGIIRAKGNGRVHLNNVVFDDCTVPENCSEVFVGTGGSTITGDNKLSLKLDANIEINAEGVANSVPVDVRVKDGRTDMTVVTGCDDPTQFTLVGIEGKKLVSGENNTLVIADDDETGVEDIEAEEGVAEYYNLQGGLRVAEDNLTDGLYIVRKGNKTVKVMIRK